MHWFIGQHVICVFVGFLGVTSAPNLSACHEYVIKNIHPPISGHYGLEIVGVPAPYNSFNAYDDRRFSTLDKPVPQCETVNLTLNSK